MEGPLIAVPASFTGHDEVGPNAEALARRIGEPRILPADVPAIRAALDGRPVVVASECVVALATLPWLAERHPDARVLWLDAHADFNTPETSPSGYVGGMPLAGATGQFDAGVTPTLPAERVVFAGLRDVDPGERELLDRSGAHVASALDAVPGALADRPVFVHLDADVVDGYPSAFPPPPGGPTADEVRELLAAIGDRNEIVGLTVASVAGPPEIPHRIVEPLL
ncbi:MAG TPA: arginase family protein [Capillimicrobium sp.]|nr:arginase family protein [Capillimicrobium sp.]